MGLTRLQSRLILLPSFAKRTIVAACDVFLLLLVLVLVLGLASKGEWRALSGQAFIFPVVVMVAVPVIASQGLYRAMIRFIGEEMLFAVVKAVSVIAIVVAVCCWWGGADLTLSIGTAAVFWAFSIVGLAACRLIMRKLVSGRQSPGERVAIYGAGLAGRRLVTAIANGRGFVPVFFIDDSPSLQGREVAGLQVWPPNQLVALVTSHGIRRVLLAMPSVSRRKRQEIIATLEPLPVAVQTVPDIADLLAGRARVEDVRDVDVVDLLGRDAVPPNSKLLAACIRGKSVMVTGAGGSIGSELCRQIVRLQPARLVLFERSEPALFSIDHELRRLLGDAHSEVEIVPLIGSVNHRARVVQAMRNFEVHTVYHAAAYKHVPLVEYNMIEGVYNNICGTWHTAEAACETGVEKFVLISTDKAVSPVNVMGATKRFSELVLQAMSERSGGPCFSIVRFGNVLDSSGSVVPVFREQIRRGGPVTVTHRDIIRYFMTIPEAAQLVLQAGSMCHGGDVFVLDMGRPVKIADLARRMIHLMGLTVRDEEHPDGDIPIHYTGLRPAEKLYEELLIGSNVTGTEHPMILRAMEESLPWGRVHHFIDQLLQACGRSDCDRVRQILLESVAGYKPTNGVDDLIWQASRMPGAEVPVQGSPASATVTDLVARRVGGYNPLSNAPGLPQAPP